MDLFKFHYVAAVIDMLNHIKQSLNFFPQTCGAQSFSLVILYANYLYFSLPDVKQDCAKSCSGCIYVFLCCTLFLCLQQQHVNHLLLSKGNFSFTTKSLHWCSVTAFHFQEQARNLLAPLECHYTIIKVKVTFDSNMLPLLFLPRGNRNRKHCFQNGTFCVYKCVVVAVSMASRVNSRTTSLDVCVLMLHFLSGFVLYK